VRRTSESGNGYLPEQRATLWNTKLDLPTIIGEKVTGPLGPFDQYKLSPSPKVLPTQLPKFTSFVDTIEVHVDKVGTTLGGIPKEEIKGRRRDGPLHTSPSGNRPRKDRFSSPKGPLEP